MLTSDPELQAPCALPEAPAVSASELQPTSIDMTSPKIYPTMNTKIFGIKLRTAESQFHISPRALDSIPESTTYREVCELINHSRMQADDQDYIIIYDFIGLAWNPTRYATIGDFFQWANTYMSARDTPITMMSALLNGPPAIPVIIAQTPTYMLQYACAHMTGMRSLVPRSCLCTGVTATNMLPAVTVSADVYECVHCGLYGSMRFICCFSTYSTLSQIEAKHVIDDMLCTSGVSTGDGVLSESYLHQPNDTDSLVTCVPSVTTSAASLPMIPPSLPPSKNGEIVPIIGAKSIKQKSVNRRAQRERQKMLAGIVGKSSRDTKRLLSSSDDDNNNDGVDADNAVSASVFNLDLNQRVLHTSFVDIVGQMPHKLSPQDIGRHVAELRAEFKATNKVLLTGEKYRPILVSRVGVANPYTHPYAVPFTSVAIAFGNIFRRSYIANIYASYTAQATNGLGMVDHAKLNMKAGIDLMEYGLWDQDIQELAYSTQSNRDFDAMTLDDSSTIAVSPCGLRGMCPLIAAISSLACISSNTKPCDQSDLKDAMYDKVPMHIISLPVTTFSASERRHIERSHNHDIMFSIPVKRDGKTIRATLIRSVILIWAWRIAHQT